MPVPTKDEQTRIAKHITRDTDDISAAVISAHHEISLLREYRTRLIADVVTGKLDVRAAAAKLPEQVDEVEPFDAADALADEEEAGEAELDAAAEEAVAGRPTPARGGSKP